MVIIDMLWYNMYSALKGCLMDKKLAKDIRRFSIISNTAFSVITTIFMGVGLGLLLDYLFEKEYWTPICSVFFTFVAIYNFIKIIVGVSKMEDSKKKEIEKINNDEKKN